MTEPASNDILEALRQVINPEIGINIIDLGRVAVWRSANEERRDPSDWPPSECPFGVVTENVTELSPNAGSRG